MPSTGSRQHVCPGTTTDLRGPLQRAAVPGGAGGASPEVGRGWFRTEPAAVPARAAQGAGFTPLSRPVVPVGGEAGFVPGAAAGLLPPVLGGAAFPERRSGH